MHKLNLLFMLNLSLFAYGSDNSGYYSLPPLKWAKSLHEITIQPQHLIEISPNSFLCSYKKNVAIIDARDGSLIKATTAPGVIVNKTLENGFYAVDGNALIVLNADLEQVWSKTIVDSSRLLISVVQTRDSGYVALADDRHVLFPDTMATRMIRLDGNGDIVFAKDLFISASGEFRNSFRIVETDSGYIVCGQLKKIDSPSLWMDGWVARYSYDGTEEWIKTIPGLSIYDMLPLQQNSIALTGSKDSEAGPMQKKTMRMGIAKQTRFVPLDILLVQIGAHGEKMLYESFEGMRNNWGNSIRKYKDTFILACYMQYYNDPTLPPTSQKVSIIAADEAGKKKWSKDYILESNTSNNYTIAQPLSSGDLIVFAHDSLFCYSPANGIIGRNGAHDIPLLPIVNKPIAHGRVGYSLAQPSTITIALLTPHGRIIRTIERGFKPAGAHSFTIRDFAHGIYLMKFQCDNRTMVRRIVFGN